MHKPGPQQALKLGFSVIFMLLPIYRSLTLSCILENHRETMVIKPNMGLQPLSERLYRVADET